MTTNARISYRRMSELRMKSCPHESWMVKSFWSTKTWPLLMRIHRVWGSNIFSWGANRCLSCAYIGERQTDLMKLRKHNNTTDWKDKRQCKYAWTKSTAWTKTIQKFKNQKITGRRKTKKIKRLRDTFTHHKEARKWFANTLEQRFASRDSTSSLSADR